MIIGHCIALYMIILLRIASYWLLDCSSNWWNLNIIFYHIVTKNLLGGPMMPTEYSCFCANTTFAASFFMQILVLAFHADSNSFKDVFTSNFGEPPTFGAKPSFFYHFICLFWFPWQLYISEAVVCPKSIILGDTESWCSFISAYSYFHLCNIWVLKLFILLFISCAIIYNVFMLAKGWLIYREKLRYVLSWS